MIFGGVLRRKALEALLEGTGVPVAYRAPVADAVNKYLMEGFLMQPKPGWKTTEFWTHLLLTIGTLGAAVAGALPAKIAAGVVAASQVAYSIARGLTKQGTTAPE